LTESRVADEDEPNAGAPTSGNAHPEIVGNVVGASVHLSHRLHRHFQQVAEN
jgi:hypothetical protein